MQSIKHRCIDNFTRPVDFVIVGAIALVLMGCVAVSSTMKMEPGSLARRIGLPNCKVSVPLTQSEVIDHTKRDGNPNPEENQEWIEMVASFQPGDQFRFVSCKKKDPYFYALIRGNTVVLTFHPLIF